MTFFRLCLFLALLILLLPLKHGLQILIILEPEFKHIENLENGGNLTEKVQLVRLILVYEMTPEFLHLSERLRIERLQVWVGAILACSLSRIQKSHLSLATQHKVVEHHVKNIKLSHHFAVQLLLNLFLKFSGPLCYNPPIMVDVLLITAVIALHMLKPPHLLLPLTLRRPLRHILATLMLPRVARHQHVVGVSPNNVRLLDVILQQFLII